MLLLPFLPFCFLISFLIISLPLHFLPLHFLLIFPDVNSLFALPPFPSHILYLYYSFNTFSFTFCIVNSLLSSFLSASCYLLLSFSLLPPLLPLSFFFNFALFSFPRLFLAFLLFFSLTPFSYSTSTSFLFFFSLTNFSFIPTHILFFCIFSQFFFFPPLILFLLFFSVLLTLFSFSLLPIFPFPPLLSLLCFSFPLFYFPSLLTAY